MIDLHAHTTASDGELSPTALIEAAAAAGLTALSITDHDTVHGIPEALRAAEAHPSLRLIPGIELSAYLDGRREIHVLGHLLVHDDPRLLAHARQLGEQRRARMEQMVARLQDAGLRVSMEAVEREAASGQFGRPHLARVLVQAGHASSMKDAFRRWLAEGRPGYVDRERLPPERAIELVHAAGGTATLAHPGSSRVEVWDLERLAAMGLDGVEALHPDHVPSLRDKFLRAAERLHLVPTGGSDYHGPLTTPDRTLGCGRTPAASLAALEARRPPPQPASAPTAGA